MKNQREKLIDILESQDDKTNNFIAKHFSNVKRLVIIHKNYFIRKEHKTKNNQFDFLESKSWGEFIKKFLTLSKEERIRLFRQVHKNKSWCESVVKSIEDDSIMQHEIRCELIGSCLDELS